HQGRGQGRHRALGRGRDSRGGRDRRGGGGLRDRGRLPREVRRRLARRDPPQPGRLPRARAELLGVPQVILTGFMATGKTEVGRRRRAGVPAAIVWRVSGSCWPSARRPTRSRRTRWRRRGSAWTRWWSACGRWWRDGEVVVARRAEARVIREQSGEEVRVELGP